MMEYAGVAQLFPSEDIPTAVSDSEDLLALLENEGFPVASIADICRGSIEPPSEALLVPVEPVQHPIPGLNDRLGRSAVLLVPLLAFDTGPKSMAYMIDRLKKVDFTEACERSKRTINYIQKVQAPIDVESNNSFLTIELGDDLDVFAPKIEPSIQPGEWISIIQFLEVAIVPHDRGPSFSVNGTLLCNGVAMAHHLHAHHDLGGMASQAWSRMADIRSNGLFPLKLTFEDNRIVDITTLDGESIRASLLPFTDEVLRGHITEIGFASLSPDQTTDWSVNSQLNEPAGGLHIGLGAGETGMHIDFVSAHAHVSGFPSLGQH